MSPDERWQQKTTAALASRYGVLKVSERRYVVIDRLSIVSHDEDTAVCHYRIVSQRLDYSAAVDRAIELRRREKK